MVSYPVARPAARTPLPPLRRPRQSLALCPSVRATTSRFVPPFALRRSRPAAPVTPSAPKPRAPSQCSRYDVPVRPAVRLPPFASRRSLPAAPVTPSAPKPRALSQRSRHDIPVRPAVRTPPPLSRRPRPVGLRRLARCAPGIPRSPSIWKRPAFLAAFGHSKRSRFVLRHRSLGLRPKPRQARRGSVSPVGCWAEGPKRPEAGQRNHERDRQGSAND